MPALPTKADLNGTPTTGVFKAAIGAVHDYLGGLLGSDGTRATAFNTLKLLDPKAIYNLSLVPSVAASALTMTVKSRDATDLAVANPGFIGQRNATLGTGQFNHRAITANIAATISSGSTLGHVSTVEGAIYWYLIDNAGTQELAFSSSFYGESGIASTTAEGGAGGADNGSVMYSATARANVPFRLIGRSLDTQTTAGTWAALPSRIDLAPFDAFTETKVKTSTGVESQFDFNGLPPGVTDIRIMYHRLSMTTAAQHGIRIGTSSGLELIGYEAPLLTMVSPVASNPRFHSNNTTLFNTTPPNGTYNLTGSFDLNLMDPATNSWVLKGMVGDTVGSSSTFLLHGKKDLAGLLDRVQVFTTGTFQTGGKVSIRYR